MGSKYVQVVNEEYVRQVGSGCEVFFFGGGQEGLLWWR